MAGAIRVFAGIKKKHSAHAITADVDMVETARAAELFQADGVIVSGLATGTPADAGKVRAVSHAVGIPTLIESGIAPENLANYVGADRFIVGSSVTSRRRVVEPARCGARPGQSRRLDGLP